MTRPRVALIVITLLTSLAVASVTRLVLITADEVIYMVGARNLLERGTLNTSFYVPESLIVQGYPHRDVHLPGYLFALTPLVAVLGPGLLAPALLNVVLLAAMVLLTHALAVRLLGEGTPAFAVAAFTAVLPPFTGYLYVAFPELLLAVLLLASVRLLLGQGGVWRTALAGALFGSSPLFREHLLLSLPIHASILPPRRFFGVFLPVAATTATLVYAVFAPGRAQLPNAVYPAILFESLQSSEPVTRLTAAVWTNVRRNLDLLADARPFANPEDGMLLFLLLLACAAGAGALQRRGLPRRMGLATLFSFGLVFAAVVVGYAIRATGRPWAGVRQFMAWEPLLLIYAVAAIWSLARWRGAALGTLAAAFVVLGAWHIRFVNDEWKGEDLRASQRFVRQVAPWIDSMQPTRIAVRSNHAFLYGLTRFPVEVIWPVRSFEELAAIEPIVDFDFLVVPRGEPMLTYLEGNARYRHLNLHDPGGKFYIWQRLY